MKRKLTVALIALASLTRLWGGDLDLPAFLKAAAGHDPRFQGYLAESLSLIWADKLARPADDLVISLSGDYALDLEDPDPENGYSGTLALGKLFPVTGTSAGTSLRLAPTGSSVTVTLEQDIARNAFGRSTRWQTDLALYANEITRFQIVEAWEDYFADGVRLWYDWKNARDALRNAEWGYRESLKLQDNVASRAARSVATATEVAQARLRVLDKKDALSNARTLYERKTRVIRYRAGIPDTEAINPPESVILPFDGWRDLPSGPNALSEKTRSGQILDLLSKRADLTVLIRRDDLLPSVSLSASYRYGGNGYEFTDPASTLSLGVELEYPFPGTRSRAGYESAKVDRDRARLTLADTLGRLWIDLSDVSLRLDTAEELVRSGRERLALSEQIYRDKQREYERGDATLDELFTAQNSVQTARLQLSTRESERDLLLLEWYRLTDQLVTELPVP